MGPAFRIHGTLLKSTNPDHQGDVGNIVTCNDAFKFKKESLARMRRMLTACLSVLEEKQKKESDITPEKANQLIGPEQPLVGLPITIIGVTKHNKTTQNPYTLYEAVIPSDSDLEGLVE